MKYKFLVVIAAVFCASLLYGTVSAKPKMMVDTPINAPYLNVGNKEYLLVFYGYVGCAHVCTPVLENLAKFYQSKEFAPYEPKVDLLFVNLLPEVSLEQPDLFAKSFNTKFIGVHLSPKELQSLDKELSVYFAKQKGEAFELDHSDFVYLIKRNPDKSLVLVNIYMTHPFDGAFVVRDLQERKRATDK
jgi:protein SCO1/2